MNFNRIFKHVSIAVLATTTVILAGCGAKSNVPEPTPLKNITPTANISTLWQRNITSGTSGHYLNIGSTVSDDTIYNAGYEGDVVASNMQNGHPIWRVNVLEPISATPKVTNNQIFVGTLSGKLIALNKLNGKEDWRIQLTSSLLSAPAATNTTVVTHTHDGTISAFSASSGKLIWSHNITSPELSLEGNSAPIISSGRVYVGFENGQLAAYDLQSGNAIWQRPIALPTGGSSIERMIDINAAPVLNNGVLYTAAYHGNVAAVSAGNGQLVWQHPLSVYTGLAVGLNAVYITDAKSRIFALNKDTGRTIWKQDALMWRSVTGPALLGNLVVVADKAGYIHFLDANSGKLAARTQLNSSGVRAKPITHGKDLIVTANDGRVAVYMNQGKL